MTSPGCSFACAAGLDGSTAPIIAPRLLSSPTASAISSVTGWMRAPIQPRSTLPVAFSCSMIGRAKADGTAKPIPIEPPEGENIAVLIPITSPERLNIGPPELPRLIDASVCKKSSYGPEWMSRAVAEIMPEVTVPPRPNGLPIASTQSPTLVLVESPQIAAGSGAFGSTLSSARSVTASRPMTSACNVVSSDNVTVICSALAITWLLVTTIPEGSMMKPEPSDAARGAGELGPPGVPFSPKKSRKNSSSGDPGEGSCASGAPLFAGAGVACVVEMLTTTPISLAASWAKTSEKGASGASARLGIAAISDSVSNIARTAARRPNDVTIYLLHRIPGQHALCLPHRISRTGVSVGLDMKWRQAWQD